MWRGVKGTDGSFCRSKVTSIDYFLAAYSNTRHQLLTSFSLVHARPICNYLRQTFVFCADFTNFPFFRHFFFLLVYSFLLFPLTFEDLTGPPVISFHLLHLLLIVAGMISFMINAWNRRAPRVCTDVWRPQL